MKLKFTRLSQSRGEAASGESISQRSTKSWSPGCTAGFFSVFLLAGLGFMMIFAIPAWRSVAALSWTEHDCEVLSSYVRSHSGDSTTYSIEVSYQYEVGGIKYVSDRYGFVGGSSSGQSSKQKVVDRMPDGAIISCYVDPEDPEEAVIHRGWSWVYLFSLLPLVFIAIGGAGVLWSLTSLRRKANQGSDASALGSGEFRNEEDWQPDPAGEPSEAFGTPGLGTSILAARAGGPVELEEKMSPLGKLVLLIFIAAFWNGIVSVFVWQLWDGWRSGGGVDGCLAVFLIPFVLVGLGLIVGVPYQLLALANPRPILRVSRGAVPLGGSEQLEWWFKGSAGRLRDLRIWLEGVEHATYRRGTDTHTDTEIFEVVEIIRVQEGMPLDNGSSTIRVPLDTMHSFEASRNKIVWTLKLHASIARWPDVMTEFPFVVEPGDGRRS